MINKTNFDKAFKEGYTFEYNQPYGEGIHDVTFSIHNIGELVVTSGRLVACDPFLPPNDFFYFPKSIKPGRYPVIASVAKLQLQQDKSQFDERIACVMLRISQKTAVTWEDTDIYGYGVDSAIGSFMDMDAALVLKALYGAGGYKEYHHRFYTQLGEFDYSPFNDYEVVRWASIQVSDTTEANVIIFTSGYGDGHYPSYWGYDEQGKLACLVTDFILFRTENDG